MRFRRVSKDVQVHAITRLVDGSLTDDGSQAVDARATGLDMQGQVASQRRVAGTLRSGGPAVPDQLASAIDGRIRDAYGPDSDHRVPTWRALRPAWWPARRWVPAVSLAGVGAVVVLGLVVALTGGSTQPSIAAAAKLAFAPATSPAPAVKSGRFLDVSYAGVTYPSYARFAVAPTGARTDRIGGRPALTVFYRLRNGVRMSYTVFSGKPVGLPRDARKIIYDGVTLREFTGHRGLAVVTLVRFDRTCVLAAPANRDTVLGLAAAPILEQSAA